MTAAGTRSLARSLAWAGDGAAHLRGLMTRMGEDAFAAPCGLPGWSRAHLLTHVARNAESLINLLAWSRTGVRTPAYASREHRDADIAAGAGRAPADIRSDVISSSDRLARVVRAMPEGAWSARVENSRGVQIPATDIPWMRAREMWIHAVDLDVGASFADLPAPMLTVLLDEAVPVMGALPDAPAVTLVAPDGTTWNVGDGAARTTVTGPAPELAAWLLGRSPGRALRTTDGTPLPALPAWL